MTHMPLAASATSFLGTLGLAIGALPVPDGVPSALPYIVSVLGPVLIAVGMRLLAGFAARKRALAEAKRKRAAQLRSDSVPTNDGDAARLEDEADALEADAAALEAAKR